MLRRIAASLIAIASFLSAGTLARAQANAPQSRVYRLAPSSTYQQGCFEPCMCPLMVAAPVRGTFRLVPTAIGDVFQFFTVQDVRWIVELPSSPIVHHVVGSGSYKISLGTNTRTHQLTLDLAIDQNLTQHFDSGLVPMNGPFPRIDITISINGVWCLDTVFTLHARPLVWVNVGSSSVAWQGSPDSTGFDVARGDLGALRASGGNFAASTVECLANGASAFSMPYAAVPTPGHGFYFIARDTLGPTAQTWDEGDVAQIRSRDPSLQQASGSCP